jgi:lysophospholipase L1-like esterase
VKNIRTTVLLVALACGIFPGLAQTAPATAVVNAIGIDDARIVLLGQIDARNPKQPRLGYPGTGLIVRFQGSSLSLHLASDSDKSALTVVIDHGDPALQLLRKGEQNIVLAAGLDAGTHTAEVYKRTETWQGIVSLLDLALPAGGALLPPSPQPVRKLMFVGDSVTCGAGVENNSTCTDDPAHPANDVYDSYGMELGRRVDAQTHLVCYGGRGVERDYRGLGIADNVLNASQFLDLSIPADENSNRAPWDFHSWTPDVIFVSLGTNDLNLQKTKPLDANAFVEDYAWLLRTLRSHYPLAAIFATEGAIVIDPLLRKYIQDAVAKTGDARIQWVQATHYPGNGCDGHPTKAQHLHMADDIEPVLRKALSW